MKKLLHQKQFVTRDHYFLPEDNQSDTQSYKERSFHEENEKKSKIQINNFTDNLNLKINIKIDDQDFSQLKVVTCPSKWKKPTKNTANLESEKRVTLQNPYQSRGMQDYMRISKESNKFFHTSINNPETHRKNKRYYNTELFSPFSQKYKNPQQRKQENYSANFDNYLQRSSQRANKFSSPQSNVFKEKPFFSVQSVQKTDGSQKNTVSISPKQQFRQYKEVRNPGRIQVREQVSLDYFSSQNSKKRLKTMISDSNEKEVESQIYLQDQHPIQVKNQISSEIGLQEYIFHHTVNDEKNISGFSDSAIYQQTNSIQQKLNPSQLQAKNAIKMNEVQMQSEGYRIVFQNEDIRGGSPKQQQQEKRVKIDEENANTQQRVDLQMYEFKQPPNESSHSSQSPPSNNSSSAQIKPTSPKSSLRSFHHMSSSSDKLSEIDKLRQFQLEGVEEQNINSLQKIETRQRKRSEQLSRRQEKNKKDFVVIGEESEVESELEEKGDNVFSTVQKQVYHQQQLRRQTQNRSNQQQQFSLTAKQIPSLQAKNSSPSIKSIKTAMKKPYHQIKEEGYSQRSRSKSKDSVIPFSTSRSKMHHHKEHCLQPAKPQPFIFQDYSCRNKKHYQYCQPQIATERSAIRQQQRIKKPSPKKEPKVVKAILTNKKAEDLFTKHKNQFLYKLKMKENSLNQTISTQEKSREKSSSKRSNFNKSQNTRFQSSSRNRSISPYVKQLSQRLYTHDLGPVCGHYQKHSKRQIRERFFSMIQQDHGNLLKQYYLSNDQLHEIFVNQILNKQMNENHWIEIVKRQGQRKLENLRLKSKSKYHPHQRSIIKKQQVAADTRRAYPFSITVLSNPLQKVKAY